jgi:2-keto-4-pentenoate hydratase/2-oxohepta-3-ene-1,7-dioic acid hydratase in catechol pathway
LAVVIGKRASYVEVIKATSSITGFIGICLLVNKNPAAIFPG